MLTKTDPGLRLKILRFYAYVCNDDELKEKYVEDVDLLRYSVENLREELSGRGTVYHSLLIMSSLSE